MKILLSGGGTGGHIYPALALTRQLKKEIEDVEFLYVGTENGLESKIVPENGIRFETIDIQGFTRSLTLDNFRTVFKFLKGIQDSKKIIKEFQPDVVIGTGGYVCAPVVYAASRMDIPSIIHEQNSVPGLANKFLARFVERIAISFEAAASYFSDYKDKLVFTGNPRAQEVASVEKTPVLEEYGLDSSKPTLLIFGGSRGAKRISDTFLESSPVLAEKNYQTLFVSGRAHYEDYQKEFLKKELDSRVQITPYIDNMPKVFTNVSLVVCRSGATTLAELTAMGKASILIPSPNVTDDHQTVNAQSLVENGAALLLEEDELTSESFIESIDKVMTDDDYRDSLENKAEKMGTPDASSRLIQLMIELAEE